MFFIYVICFIFLAVMFCSNNYILDNIQQSPKGVSLRLLSEIYKRQSGVYDTTMFTNNNNIINLKNLNNFNINSLNDRIFYYSSSFQSENAWNRAAISIFNLVNLDIDYYVALLQKSPTPYNIKICEVWAYVHLLDLQNK